MSLPRTWDIFCKVVDNYGDAAVCWRLAQQIAAEHDGSVRLWINDLTPLHAMCPDVSTGAARQTVAAVEVRAWPLAWQGVEPAQIVIEAFGCGLPEAYVDRMSERTARSLWIVLEYLSAERWVSQHHGLTSPHPRWPIPRYFFFPGFVEGTGGVLRERDLLAGREAFGREARREFWALLGFELPEKHAVVVSIFTYEGAPVGNLLSAWASGGERVVACIPHGPLVPRITHHLGCSDTGTAGETLRQANLEVRFLPFLAQPQYDALLWSCDCNFVRGEDSFVRAQWAALPFIWNIYPQKEEAHWPKLEAFLDLYCADLPADAAASVREMWHAWNGAPGAGVDTAWRAYWLQRRTLFLHARDWAARLASKPDLATSLAKFCAERLQ